jgi:hypothetical protein
METMKEYVIRKLNDRAINLVQVGKDLKMNRSKIYRIKDGGETSYTALETLHNYFKKLGE